MSSALQHLHDVVRKVSRPRVRLSYNPAWHIGEKTVWINPKPKQFYTCLNDYEQISVNTRDFKNAIIFDVDDPEKYIPPEVAPYTSTFNKNNGKHHALFLLKEPIYTKSQKQKEWYRDNIGSALQKIYFLVGADTNYKNYTTKNPFNTKLFDVVPNLNRLDSVFDLISLFNNDLNSIGKIESAISKDNQYISPQYREFVSKLIEHSQLNVKLLFTDRNQFERVLHLQAHHLSSNVSKTFSDSVPAICDDVIAKSFAWADEVSRRQKRRAMKSHKKRWGDKVYNNMIRIQKELAFIELAGINPTIENISKRVGLSKETLKRAPYNKWIKRLKKKWGLDERLEVTQMLFDFNEDLPSSEKIVIPPYDATLPDEYQDYENT